MGIEFVEDEQTDRILDELPCENEVDTGCEGCVDNKLLRSNLLFYCKSLCEGYL